MNPHARLTTWQREFVLQSLPDIDQIISSAYVRPDWLPAPIRVDVHMRDGGSRSMILKNTPRPVAVNETYDLDSLIEYEAAILGSLMPSGLPVPEVIAGPERNPDGNHSVLLTYLPGTNLQTLSDRSEHDLQQSMGLVVEAIQQLHRITDFMAHGPAGEYIPRVSLSEELETVEASAGAWNSDPVFRDAVIILGPVLKHMDYPLVFTNGDYQPGNFLVEKGKLSGFLDFEFARFEDPIYGIAKYRVYDMLPLDRAGMVDFYLDRMGFTQTEFQSRQALRCLWTLGREYQVDDDTRESRRILGLLESSISALG